MFKLQFKIITLIWKHVLLQHSIALISNINRIFWWYLVYSFFLFYINCTYVFRLHKLKNPLRNESVFLNSPHSKDGRNVLFYRTLINGKLHHTEIHNHKYRQDARLRYLWIPSSRFLLWKNKSPSVCSHRETLNNVETPI